MEFNNIQFDMPKQRASAIKVIGVGGGGSNAVNHMFKQGITGVDFVVSNTDAQALNNSPVPNKVQLGASITEGMGAGSNPEIGEQSALESVDDIKKLLDTNTKMVFITAGMGGGTGTGAAPIIAGIAKEMGILTVGICTSPFYFEGEMKIENARKGIEKFRETVDSLIIIKNDKLRELYGNLSYKSAFAKADEVLTTAAKGIAEVITHHYSTNIDLRDARTVLADSGTAIMGSAKAGGENKAKKAIELALDSPLLNDNKITGARNVLLLIVSGDDEVTMDEIGLINEYIQNQAEYKANIIMGIGEDDSLGEDMSVTVIATGFPLDQQMSDTKKEPIIHYLDEEDTKSPYEKPFINSNKEVEPEIKSETEEKFEEVTKNKEEIKPENEDLERIELSEEEEEDLFNFELKVTEKPKTPLDNEAEDCADPINSTITETNKKSAENQPNKSNSPKLTLFELDENEEVDSFKVSDKEKEGFENNFNEENANEEFEVREESEDNQITEEIDEGEMSNPFDSSIEESINQTISERRARLKKYCHKFKTSVQSLDEKNTEPAYKRNKSELSEHKREGDSSYIVDTDVSGEVKIRPNNFLKRSED